MTGIAFPFKPLPQAWQRACLPMQVNVVENLSNALQHQGHISAMNKVILASGQVVSDEHC